MFWLSSIFFLRLVSAAVSIFFFSSLSPFVSHRVLRKKKLRNVVLRTVFDNNQEPKLSVKTKRGGAGVYGSPRGFLGRQRLAVLKRATESHQDLRLLVTRCRNFGFCVAQFEIAG